MRAHVPNVDATTGRACSGYSATLVINE